MKFLVLLVLAYTSAASAQLLGGLGAVGSKVGGKVGSDIGLITGTALDTVPSVIGLKPRPEPGLSRPIPPVRAPGARGRGSSSVGGRRYEDKNYESEYSNGGDYTREKAMYEKERRNNYEGGRDWKGNQRGKAGSRSDYYEY